MAKIGDLYEIEMESRRGFFQYCFKSSLDGSLIRVFKGVYTDVPKSFDEIINEEESFWIYFPVESVRRHGGIRRIGTYNIPSFVQVPPVMRTTLFNISNGKVNCLLRKGDERLKCTGILEEDFFSLSKVMICDELSLKNKILSGWRPIMSRF